MLEVFPGENAAWTPAGCASSFSLCLRKFFFLLLNFVLVLFPALKFYVSSFSCFKIFFICLFIFDCIGSQLQHMGSFVAVCRLLSCGVPAQLPHSTWDFSSWTRDQTCIPCIGRGILNHWITREVPLISKDFSNSIIFSLNIPISVDLPLVGSLEVMLIVSLILLVYCLSLCASSSPASALAVSSGRNYIFISFLLAMISFQCLSFIGKNQLMNSYLFFYMFYFL